jgi:hypothetical protein
MATHYPPRIQQDVDRFEDQKDVFLKEATPQEIVEGVGKASRHLEREAERANLNFNHTNNATSLVCSAALELDRRLAAAQARIAELELQVAELQVAAPEVQS